MAITIRLILTAILIYLAYGETGPWTALALTLIMINDEIIGMIARKEANIL